MPSRRLITDHCGQSKRAEQLARSIDAAPSAPAGHAQGHHPHHDRRGPAAADAAHGRHAEVAIDEHVVQRNVQRQAAQAQDHRRAGAAQAITEAAQHMVERDRRQAAGDAVQVMHAGADQFGIDLHHAQDRLGAQQQAGRRSGPPPRPATAPDARSGRSRCGCRHRSAGRLSAWWPAKCRSSAGTPAPRSSCPAPPPPGPRGSTRPAITASTKPIAVVASCAIMIGKARPSRFFSSRRTRAGRERAMAGGVISHGIQGQNVQEVVDARVRILRVDATVRKRLCWGFVIHRPL